MKKTLSIMVFVLSAVAFSQNALASKTRKCHKKASLKITKFIKSLDLTDEQRQKIKTIKRKQSKNALPKWHQVKQLKKQIRNMAYEKQYDENQLNQLIDKKYQLIASLSKSKIKSKHAIFAVLNENQKEKYRNLLKQDLHGKCHD